MDDGAEHAIQDLSRGCFAPSDEPSECRGVTV
jgi:hypothetical protein